MTRTVKKVIQNDNAKVGTGIVVRRSIWVPKAHVLAAPKASKTPMGLPDKLENSCQSKNATPTLDAATPAHARTVMRLLKNKTPSTAEKIGMV